MLFDVVFYVIGLMFIVGLWDIVKVVSVLLIFFMVFVIVYLGWFCRVCG